MNRILRESILRKLHEVRSPGSKIAETITDLAEELERAVTGVDLGEKIEEALSGSDLKQLANLLTKLERNLDVDAG